MNLQTRLRASSKRWPVVSIIATVVMLSLLAASGCGTTASSGGSSGGGSNLGSSSGAESLAQWTQQYGGNVTALLDAANNDMNQISTYMCNSNYSICPPAPNCGNTVTAANTLQSDPAPPDLTIQTDIVAGALELADAADHCASVQDFIQGYGDIGKAAQSLGLPPTG